MRIKALDAALEFHQQLVIPSTWKTEVKEESSSSEEEEDDEEEEQEEGAGGEEEEVDAELFTRSSPYIVQVKTTLQPSLFPVCRRKWSRSPRRGRTFCSSCTSSWKTEVNPVCTINGCLQGFY